MNLRPAKKILFVRSPRYNEFYLPESMSFQIPLGMCSIASYLKKSDSKHNCEIIDCPAEHIGWRSLEKMIEEKKPDVVAAGEPQGFFYHESIKVLELAKRLNPKTITIAGGSFFSSLPDFIFSKHNAVDFIIKGEAEITFTELIKTLNENKDPQSVEGIVFKKNGETFHTPERALIKNLDDLPLPSYDLLPIEKYFWYSNPPQACFPLNFFFKEQKISPSVVIETSRGCTFDCDFCSLWSFWGEKINEKKIPCFRKKSVQRVIEEIEICYEKYGRRFFFFTDPTFNISEDWTQEFCEQLLKKEYPDISWFAYLRPDFVVRDDKSGLLEKMVKCGLSNAFMGAEKNPKNSLHYQGKTDACFEASTILTKKYPHIHTTVSFLACMPQDSYDDMRSLIQYGLTLNPDTLFAGFFVFPGSLLFEKYSKLKNFKIKDFFSNNYSPKILYYASTKKHLQLKKILFFVSVRSNLALAQLFLLFNRHKNKIFRWISSRLQALTYKNNTSFTIISILFLILLLPFLLSRRSAFIKTCWLWRKPRWYNN